MKELFIRVSFPGRNEAIYRFRETPVRVGRSPECHLSICHQAVPRELCIAWLEEDGRTVRVEERPQLTNPLLKGKNLVTGGVSGKSIELTVGPLKLQFASEEGRIDVSNHKSRRPIRPVFFAIVGLALFSIAALSIFKDVGSHHQSGIRQLPDDPLCRTVTEYCESPHSCLERARLLATRARELLLRPGHLPINEIRAASLLGRAARLYESGNAPEADDIRREATQIEDRVRDSYKRDVVALRRSLESGGPNHAGDIAKRVHSYLIDCDGPGRRWLSRLIASTNQNKE